MKVFTRKTINHVLNSPLKIMVMEIMLATNTALDLLAMARTGIASTHFPFQHGIVFNKLVVTDYSFQHL